MPEVAVMLTPFSWPSMTPCCRFVKTSLQLVELGTAPKALKKLM